MLKKTTRRSWFLIAVVVCLGVFLSACAASTTKQDPNMWQPTLKNCWCCAIYGTTFQVVNDFVTGVVAAVIPVARLVLAMGLLFVLLQRIGSAMLFVEEKKVLEMWKELGIIFLKVMLVALLLSNADQFLGMIRDYVIYPIGGFFVLLSNAVLDAVPGGNRYFPGIIGVTPDMNAVVVIDGDNGVQEVTNSLFGDLGIQVQYIVSRIFAALKSGIPLVLRVLANGGLFSGIIGFVMLYELIGLMIIFPVAFVDAFVLIGIDLIFLPICFALWALPWKKQSQYLGKILFPHMLAAFVDILFGCIVAVLMVTLLQVYTDISLDGILRETTQATNAVVSEKFSSGKPSALIFLVLIMAVKKIALEIGGFTAYFTGSEKELSIFTQIQKGAESLRKAAVAFVEMCAAIASGGTSAAGSVIKEAAQRAAKEEAQKVAARAARRGGGNPSGGGGS